MYPVVKCRKNVVVWSFEDFFFYDFVINFSFFPRCFFFIFSFFRSWIRRIQSTTRDLELAPKPSGSGGSVGSGSRGSNTDLGAFSNGSTGGADSPTNSGGAAAASSAPPAHPSRDILEEVLSKPGPYPMVRK